MSDDVIERQRKCREKYSIISGQFREIMAKVETVEATPKKKKPRRSKKNIEAVTSSVVQKTESVREACKDLANTIRGCLKELGEDVHQDDAAGPPAGNN